MYHRYEEGSSLDIFYSNLLPVVAAMIACLMTLVLQIRRYEFYPLAIRDLASNQTHMGLN